MCWRSRNDEEGDLKGYWCLPRESIIFECYERVRVWYEYYTADARPLLSGSGSTIEWSVEVPPNLNVWRIRRDATREPVKMRD